MPEQSFTKLEVVEAPAETSKAVHTRGISFIAAARLIVANLSPDDIQKIKDYSADKFLIQKAL